MDFKLKIQKVSERKLFLFSLRRVRKVCIEKCFPIFFGLIQHFDKPFPLYMINKITFKDAPVLITNLYRER